MKVPIPGLTRMNCIASDGFVKICGNWINAAIINASQYIEQAIWSKNLMCCFWDDQLLKVYSMLLGNINLGSSDMLACFLLDRYIYFMPINQTLIVYMFITDEV